MSHKYLSFGNSAVAICGLLFGSLIAHASSVTYTTSGSGSDGALSASADFTTSSGQITIVLTNTLSASAFGSPGQAVSDVSFTLGNSPGTLGSTSASGQMGDISAAAHPTGVTVSYTSGSPSRFLGTNPGGFGISGDTITLETIGGGQPTEMIAPYVANGGSYPSGNNGLRNFNPYTIGAATFTLDLSGVNSSTTVSDVNFSFGTGPDTTLSGTPGTPPPAVTPEPSSLMLLGTGVLGAAGVLRRRFV